MYFTFEYLEKVLKTNNQKYFQFLKNSMFAQYLTSPSELRSSMNFSPVCFQAIEI